MAQTSVADNPVRAYEGKVHAGGVLPAYETLLASGEIPFGKAVALYADSEVTLGSQRCKLPASPAEGQASKACSAETYALVDGDTMVIDVDNVGNATVTFNAASGSVTDTTSYAVSDQSDKTEKITVDGGTEQTVTFPASTTTALQVAAAINDQIEGAHATVTGGQVVITSDTEGTGSTIAIGAGTCDLTWDTPVAGTGDAVNADAVTAAELETLIEGDCTALVTVSSGVPTIYSPTYGTGSELDFISGTILAKVGLSVETISAPAAGDLASTNFRGIAVADPSHEAVADTYGAYEDKDAVSVMRKGRVWVVSADTVDDISKGVYVRYQNGSATPPTATLGSFRATANADYELVSSLKWLAGETIGGVYYGLLEINLP